MPTRSRSHQLEDISINRFTALIPELWVVRRKEADYGIDLEVEVFNTDGQATGLMFFVQLRATDNLAEATKIKLKVDQIGYFLSLQLPTLVVRYCRESDRFFWQWHFNIAATANVAHGQKTFTFRFGCDDEWLEQTPVALQRTLTVRNQLKNYPSHQLIEIRYESVNLANDVKYEFQQGIEILTSKQSRVLAKFTGQGQRLVVDIIASEFLLSVGIDCFASLSFQMDHYERNQVANSIRYALVGITLRHQLSMQANQLARDLLTGESKSHSRYLALEACRALGSDLNRSVQLALINDLHKYHDEYYRQFVEFLLICPQSEADRDCAVERFYHHASQEALAISKEMAGAVEYSWGNYKRNRNLKSAVKHLNSARKLRPDYMAVDYFLGEFGALMFGCGRFGWAKKFYKAAVSLRSSMRLELYLGDALLFAGDILEAADRYRIASDSDEVTVCIEAQLKLGICFWILTSFPNRPEKLLQYKADRLMNDVEEGLELRTSNEIIRLYDPTHDWAHFNLGIDHAKDGKDDQATAHFLLCAFRKSGDLEAWCNAIVSSFQSGDIEIPCYILMCAISLSGIASYSHFRSTLTKRLIAYETIEILDEIAHDLQKIVETSQSDDLTIRDLSEPKFDVALAIQEVE